MLSRLVNIMVSLELRFVQERAEDGQLLYRLDPWVWGPCSCWTMVADVRQQASGFVRDIRWQARSGYSSSALCHKAPCGHRGQSTLTPCQEVGSGAMAAAWLTVCSHRSMLSSRSVMQRPSSELNRPSLLLSLAAQERPKMQTKMVQRKRMAMERWCLPPPRASHRGKEVKSPLQIWTSWKRSAIFPFFLITCKRLNVGPIQKSLLSTSSDDRL